MSENEGEMTNQQVVKEVIKDLRVHILQGARGDSKLLCYFSCKLKTPLGIVFLNSIALSQSTHNGYVLNFPSKDKEVNSKGFKDFFYFDGPLKDMMIKEAVEAYKIHVDSISKTAQYHTQKIQQQ